MIVLLGELQTGWCRTDDFWAASYRQCCFCFLFQDILATCNSSHSWPRYCASPATILLILPRKDLPSLPKRGILCTQTYKSTFTDICHSWFVCCPGLKIIYCSFLQVWIHDVAIGTLVYSVEKICDDSGEDPTCCRSSYLSQMKEHSNAL